MIDNTTKRRLLAGETVFGCFLRYPEPTLAEFLALGGWDFIVFDAEHGALQPRDVEDLARACELHGVTPVVRATTNDPAVILRYMDAGPHGVHVPWVNSGAAAEAAVRAVKYQPRGERGLAGTRAARFGIPEPLGDYTARANEETLVVIQIETADAAARIDEFTAIDGVDVLFLGPTDLSHSLGVAGQKDHPTVTAAMDRVATAVTASDKALGIFVGTTSDALRWRERGARYITTGLEPIVRPAAARWLDEARRRG